MSSLIRATEIAEFYWGINAKAHVKPLLVLESREAPAQEWGGILHFHHFFDEILLMKQGNAGISFGLNYTYACCTETNINILKFYFIILH